MKVRIFAVVAVLAIAVAAYMIGRAGAPRQVGGAEVHDVSGKEVLPDAPPVQLPSTDAKEIVRGPLPGAGAPLKNAFANLQARANAGDSNAATRLVRDLNRCSRLRESEWRNASTAEDLTSHKTEGMSPAQLRTYQVLLDTMELRQQGARKDRDLCAGVSDAMLGTLVDNIAQAARLGDEQARACYLDRGPLYDARSLLDHPESLRNYRSNVSSMIDRGLAAGDWRVVDLLQRAYEPGAQGLLAGVVGTDPVQHYRYLKLYRLGAESHRAAKLDRELASAAANLTPVQLGDADAWAQTSARDRFEGNSTNTTPEGWDTCAF